MKEAFVRFVRDLRDPVRAQRQEKIREVELTWSAEEFSNFQLFVMGLHASEMDSVCNALSDAQAVPLLEILAEFAEQNPSLMPVAFRSMEKTSQEARIFLAKRLINSSNPVIRAKTCEMLGKTGARSIPLLESALEDDESGVRCAAVEAIVQGDFKKLASRILPLLRYEDKQTRNAALRAIARFGITASDNARDLLKILEDAQEDEEARRLAAGILARAGNVEARAVLLDAIRNSEAPAALRMAAAESLSAYDDPEALRAVFYAAGDSDSRIAQMSKISLNRRTSAAFALIATQIMDDDDPRLASRAALLMGGLAPEIAAQPLLDRLETEHRPLVIDAIAQAMGICDIPGAWGALLRKLKTEGIDDPDFFSALGNVAQEENLPEFASLFDTTTDAGSKRTILDALSHFALTSPVVPEMNSLATRVLNSQDKSLHMAAATILAHDPNLDADNTVTVLTSISHLEEDSQKHAVVMALLRNRHGALSDLFIAAPSDTAQILAFAANEATNMGQYGVALFRKVANWARIGASGAKDALHNMAFLAPASLVEAMTGCKDQLFLIEAWSSLPVSDREANLPNFKAFFEASSPQDAIAGIHILNNIKNPQSFQALVDAAFASTYPEVREAALTGAREFILAQ